MTTGKPHIFDSDPRETRPLCLCGQTTAYRAHQPLWWRWLHPGVKWR